MLTIKDIHDMYYNVFSFSDPATPDKHKTYWIGDFNDLPPVEDIDKYHHVIIRNIPWADILITNILIKYISGCHVGMKWFLEDIPDDVIRNTITKISDNIPEHFGGRRGISIQHIKGVGYIITPAIISLCNNIYEYTPTEYIRRQTEYVICAMAKQEYKYIEDWVKYHLHIGFDRIYLYDNNDPDGERYDGLLKEYIASGQLEIIDIRGKKGIQNAVYNEFYHSQPFEYLAVIDIDEFIWLDERCEYTNIKDFIKNTNNKNPINYGIMLQWHCYAGCSNDDANRPIWEKNTIPINPTLRESNRPEFINGWCKSIYRHGYSLQLNEHFGWDYNISGAHNIKMIDYAGKYIDKQYIEFNVDELSQQSVYIKHFILRSIENIYHNKYRRGHAGFGDNDVAEDGWKWWRWYHNMNYYTDVTPVLTPEEQIFMLKKGMRVNYTFHPDVIVIYNKLQGNTNLNTCISNIIHNVILGASNTLLVDISTPAIDNLSQPNYHHELNLQEQDYGFNFLCTFRGNSNMAGHFMNDEPWLQYTGHQEPIVINIGFPLEYMYKEIPLEQQQEYITIFEKLFSPYNFRTILRTAIDDPGLFILPLFGVVDYGDAMGWDANISEFLKSNGYDIPKMGINNNTFITSLGVYKKLKQFQQLFISKYGLTDDRFIIDNIKAGYTTPYHAYIYSYPAIFNNIYYIKP